MTTDTEAERCAAFEQLIKGKYKDLFGQRMQQVVETRFKEKKSLQEKQAALQPMMDTLAQKYGLEAGDVDKRGRPLRRRTATTRTRSTARA